MAKPPRLPILANSLNELLTESDGKDLSLRIKGDTATLVVKDVDSGTVITQKLYQHGFKQWSRFNPEEITSSDRANLVKTLIDEDKMTQSEVASYLGISQSQVSKDYRR